ncbi:MAG: hypothetical protein KA521_00310 [Crocinitomicaceae bacterium]|jgi:hypothetical protein|nr:hypothetical protein [Crocinitomicaceae bacterium]
MKQLIVFIFIVFSSVSCTKDCTDSQQTKCSATPETGTICAAYFESWFYNQGTNTCELIGYSGCSPVGFETKEECESCDCNQ